MERTEGEDATRAVMWSNLFRVDYSDGSVLKADSSTLEKIRATQRGLLRDELSIMRPGSVVFLSGPNYDFELKAEFEGVEFHPIDGLPARQIARLNHSRLPTKSFRTYHPSYLSRSHKWDFISTIAGLITGAA
jgi:hypothetical protein